MKGVTGEMRSTLRTSENLENLYTLSPYTTKPATNAGQLQDMKRFLNAVVDIALTKKQREVADLYFGGGKKADEIAVELGMTRRNVYLHLQGVKRKLEKTKKYL